MINDKKVLAIIPARGGSKRLPRKNIMQLGGKPLIAWTILAGMQSKFIDKVIVSTDDKAIADISRQYGADVPFIRSDELSTDTATSMDVVRNAIQFIDVNNQEYEYVILLQPTSPLRTSLDIDEAFELLIEKKCDGIVSVMQVDHPVEWTNTLGEDLSLHEFLPEEVRNLRSQDLPIRYRINGALYLSRIKTLLQAGTFIYGQGQFAHIMDAYSSIDIDTEIDFMLAETVMRSAHYRKILT